ncbi:hypothetical protein [Bacillus sp. NEB1478]|uniref:hypothetical protein n=1 Tax=Bacillus sp. NEB1478 TaxID=3073816 RepID=UPI0028732672|nr:hypothetical protein [Bacillus sp. NEB1478]WNB90754.1 hypothetical protein RGB74_12605 [Bacillus sp. NEB1478]
MKISKPLLIYIILLLSMLTLLITIDVIVGTPLVTILYRSFYSFFRYVDRIEFFLIIVLLIYPILLFIWQMWVKKKQRNA